MKAIGVSLLMFQAYHDANSDMPHQLDLRRCVVRRVNTDSGIVSVDLRLSQVPPSSLLYTRSLLWEMFTAMAVSKSKGTSKHHDASEKGQRKPLWARFECGMNLKAKVIEHGEDGVFLETGDEGEEQRMLCPPEHTPDAALEVGAEVEVSQEPYLDLETSKGRCASYERIPLSMHDSERMARRVR